MTWSNSLQAAAGNPFALKKDVEGLSLGGGGGGGNDYASNLFATITRQQWSNYVNTFIPLENKLIDYATNPDTVKNAMSGASEDVNAAFDAQTGATERRLKGLGVTLDADEQGAQAKSTGLARSLADVGGQNVARDLTTQRQQQILGNPAPQGV